jgi:hypothetical protein
MRYGFLALAMGFVPWSFGSEIRKARIISGFRRILPIKYGSAGEIHAVRRRLGRRRPDLQYVAVPFPVYWNGSGCLFPVG